MDSNLFIDLQYADALESRYLGFRASYYADSFGNVCSPGSHMVRDMIDAEYELKCRAEDHQRTYRRLREVRIENYRYKLKNQMLDPRSRRYLTPSKYHYEICRTAFKKFGEMLKESNRDNHDQWEYIETLNTMAQYSSSSASRAHSKMLELFDRRSCCHDIVACDDCCEYTDRDSVVSSDCDDMICDNCRDDHYTWSEAQDTHIHSDYCVGIYHSVRSYNRGCYDDYCTEDYARRNYYHYDGQWFYDSDDRDEVRAENDPDYDDDRDEDEDEERYDDGLSSYHGAYRDFTEQNAKGTRPALGVEIEVYAPERADAVSELKSEFSAMIFERDGSLDGGHGFEIITVPYGLEEWNSIIPPLTKTMQEQNIVGFNEPAGSGYGIHVTIHRRHFSPLAEARISLFLSAPENADFVRAIAQRNQIYCPYNGVGIGHELGDGEMFKLKHVSNGVRALYNAHSQGTQRKIMGKGKYAPVNWKSDQNLAEFRIFQSTTNPSSFAKNLEFVWAMHAWTKESTGSTYHHLDFVKWLNTAQRRKDYPFLSTFLSKKVFYGSNFEPIKSTWRNLMVKPLEISAVEPMAA